MSAYLASNDCLNALATYYHLKNVTPDNKSGYELAVFESIASNNPHMTCQQAADTAHNIVKLDYDLTYESNKAHPIAALVFDQLLKENKNSLKALYPKQPDMWRNDYKFEISPTVTEWVATKNVEGFASLASMARGLIYQSCEHKGYRTTPAFYLIKEIQETLLNDIIKCHLLPHNIMMSYWQDPKKVNLKTH